MTQPQKISQQSREFHLAEYVSLREEIGRWQEIRAQLERLAIAAILAIWSFAATNTINVHLDMIALFIWWIPVFIAYYANERIKLIHKGIRRCADYLCEIYGFLADPQLGGWEAWLRHNQTKPSDLPGVSKMTIRNWNLVLAATIIVAAVVSLIEVLELEL